MFRESLRQRHLNGSQQSASDKSTALGKAIFSLQKMSQGGIHDHVGGGFHRYSVDEYWHVPHFEKMLYDNGQLATAYLEAALLSNDAYFSLIARDILDYLIRDMTSQEGGIYSAEDADSLDLETKHKTEGAFYIWQYDELQNVIKNHREFKNFESFYNVKIDGNCNQSIRSDPHGEFKNKNCLYTNLRLDEVSQGEDYRETNKELSTSREKVYQNRENRPRPGRDDKIIASWNGITLQAFAKAGRILTKEEFIKEER